MPALLGMVLLAMLSVTAIVAEGTWSETALGGVLTLVAVAAASGPSLTGMAGVAGGMGQLLPAEMWFTT